MNLLPKATTQSHKQLRTTTNNTGNTDPKISNDSVMVPWDEMATFTSVEYNNTNKSTDEFRNVFVGNETTTRKSKSSDEPALKRPRITNNPQQKVSSNLSTDSNSSNFSRSLSLTSQAPSPPPQAPSPPPPFSTSSSSSSSSSTTDATSAATFAATSAATFAANLPAVLAANLAATSAISSASSAMSNEINEMASSSSSSSTSSSSLISSSSPTFQAIVYPCECVVCGVELINNMDNIDHKCEQDRKHQCKICKKRFKRRTHLDIHARIHSGVKPHPCEYCEQRFPTKTAYRVHLRKHTNERPFVCPHKGCFADFKQKMHMLRHQRTHTGSKPFSCPICKRAFAQKSSCIRHVRAIHEAVENPITNKSSDSSSSGA